MKVTTGTVATRAQLAEKLVRAGKSSKASLPLTKLISVALGMAFA